MVCGSRYTAGPAQRRGPLGLGAHEAEHGTPATQGLARPRYITATCCFIITLSLYLHRICNGLQGTHAVAVYWSDNKIQGATPWTFIQRLSNSDDVITDEHRPPHEDATMAAVLVGTVRNDAWAGGRRCEGGGVGD